MTNLPKKISAFIIILLSVVSTIFSQTLTISGKLFDKEDGRTISNETIILYPGNDATTTNLKGEY